MYMLFLFLNTFILAYTGNSFPKSLPPEEEERLIDNMLKGNIEARNTLIEHNLRLVAHIAKKYTGQDTEEIISIGTIGLIKAVSTYKSDKGYKLATYAARCIENEILMYIRKLKKSKNDVSLQDYTAVDKDGNKVSLEDKIPDDNICVEREVEVKSSINEVMDRIKNKLTPRERQIIIYRYGIGCNPKTQQEIAKIFNISRSYVSRIEKAALKKLRS